jgi:tetratricopeptide (TPR) repeat protein
MSSDGPDGPDEVFLGELLGRFVADLNAGREPDVSAAAAGREPLLDRIGETLAVARAIATRRPAARPRIAGYEILSELGRGGMGAVFLAQDATGRRVALKVLPQRWTEGRDERERFQREIAAVARLRHPHVVAVYESGMHEGTPWFAMELLDGRTLAQQISQLRDRSTTAELGPEHVRRAAAIAADLAAALAHAHERGVVHRDVKPANVILRGDGRVVLFDFGLAAVADEASLTQSGAFLGTPQYAAPEQASGRAAADARADVWSLGAVLYELLTLRPPFGGSSALETVHRAGTEAPPLPSELNPHVPPALATLVLLALEKDPVRRLPSALAFSEALGRFLRGEPLELGTGAAVPAGAAEARRAEAAAALGRTAREMSVLLADRPQLLAAFRSTLAKSYWDLGLPGPARENAGEAYAVLERALGSRAPESVRALAEYARAVRRAGDVEGAVRLGREAVRRAGTLADGHLARLFAETSLAGTLLETGAAAEAAPLIRHVCDHASDDPSADPVAGLQYRHNEALLLQNEGRLDEAQAAFREVYDRRTSLLGPRDPQTLDALVCLVTCELRAGRPADALALSEDLLVRARDVAGEASPLLAMALNNHASILARTGRTADAEATQRRAVDAWTLVAGPGSYDAAQATVHLARLLLGRGDAAGAANLLRPAADALATSVGAAHPVAALAQASFAEALLVAGHEEAARAAAVSPAGVSPAADAPASGVGPVADAVAALYERAGRPGDAARLRAAPPPSA